MQAKFPIQWLYPAQTSESRWLSAQAQDAESASGGKLLAIVDGRLVAVPSGSPGLSVDWEGITGKPAVFPPDEHSHSQYLTESEIQALIDASIGENELSLPLDGFGRVKVGSPAPLSEHGFEYDLNPEFMSQKVVGSGTITHNSNKSSAILGVTAALNDRAVIQQRRYNFYEKGKAQISTSTCVFNAAVEGAVKRMGYFDDNNGVWLEQNGTNGFRSVLRSAVSGSVVDTAVDQSAWTDEDGNPSEGRTLSLNPLYQQVWGHDSQYLGAGMVKTFFNIDGRSVTAHCFRHSNRSALAPYMRTFTLPCRYEIVQQGTTSAAEMQAICFEVHSNGGTDTASAHGFSTPSDSFYKSCASGVMTPLVAIRPKTTFGGVVNRIPILAREWGVYTEDQACAIELLFNPTLTVSGGWTSAGASSCVEYHQNITSFSGGVRMDADYIESAKKGSGRIGGNIRNLYPLGLDVDGANPTNILVCAEPRSGASDCGAVIKWTELR